jgi:antitoxin component of MazEF toxin-antitoxin module
MYTKVQSWGGSQVIILTKKLIDMMGIQVNDSVELIVDRNRIIIQKPKKYDLKTLFSGYTGETPEEFWDGPKGREEW